MTGNGYYVNRLKICIGKKSPLVKLFLADLSHLEPLCGGSFFRLPPQPPGCHLSYNTEAAVVGEDVQCLYHSCRGDEL